MYPLQGQAFASPAHNLRFFRSQGNQSSQSVREQLTGSLTAAKLPKVYFMTLNMFSLVNCLLLSNKIDRANLNLCQAKTNASPDKANTTADRRSKFPRYNKLEDCGHQSRSGICKLHILQRPFNNQKG